MAEIREIKEYPRKSLFDNRKTNPQSPTLCYFLKLSQEYSSYLYMLSNTSLLIYDGEFPLCTFLLSSLSISPETPLVNVNISIDIHNPLVLQCLNALFLVLPIELFNTLNADITHKLFDNRINSRYNNDIEKQKDRSSEMGIVDKLAKRRQKR